MARVHVEVSALTGLDAGQRADLVALVRRAGDADDHPALPEPQQLALSGLLHPPEGSRIVSATDDEDELVGCAVVTPDHDGSTTLHVVLDPHRSDGASTFSVLVERALQPDVTGSGPVHLWAMQAGPAADGRAEHLGFVPRTGPAPDACPPSAGPRGAAKRRGRSPPVPSSVGKDEEAWLRSNNRAFASHPEQGSWTREQLEERLAARWVDLEGFLVADDPAGHGLVGSCWTKLHRDRVPVLGEIYVIGVDPAYHGRRLGPVPDGRRTGLAGAPRRCRSGCSTPTRTTKRRSSLYRSLGFTVDHVDRSYRRDPAGGDGQVVPTPVPTARPTP